MNVKTATVIRALVLCGLVNLWCSANYNAVAQSQPVWQTVAIANLPANCSLRSVWARNRNEAYVWAQRVVANSPQSFLFRWDGAAWNQVLALTNYDTGKIFGTGTSEVFISAEYYPGGFAGAGFARIFRSTDNGFSWTPQTLPSAVANGVLGFGTIGGTPNNVHVGTGTHIVRFDGTSWNTVFTGGIYGLTLIGPNEGYYVNCLNWGSWNGASWASRGSASLGCDAYGGGWGLRGAGGLSMYAVGQNNFNNGVRVWGFNEGSQTWGQVFSDGTSGNGLGVWGSASTNVYVVGDLISGATHIGHVYHYNGTSWQDVTDVGSIPRPGGVGGTAANDVWISLGAAGTMLHYAPPRPSLSIGMYAGITITGQTNATYQLQYATNLSSPITWTALTNLTLPSSPYLFFDATSGGQPNRSYRALLIQ